MGFAQYRLTENQNYAEFSIATDMVEEDPKFVQQQQALYKTRRRARIGYNTIMTKADEEATMVL